MSVRMFAILGLLLWLAPGRGSADDLLYQYEADTLPYEGSAGWEVFNPCQGLCTESAEGGHLILRWPEAGDLVNYDYRIADPPTLPPPTLWVEWRFRSNHPLGLYFYTCDGRFTVNYGGMFEKVFLYGDAAISFSAEDFVLGLDIDDFHTYRYESLDGVNYQIAVDGDVFIVDAEDNGNGYHYLQFGGMGGCTSDQIPDMINEWDFIRYGTISYGEKVVGSDPPAGFVDAAKHAGIDRFAVTFDSPNYVYIDQVTVTVTGGDAPVVTQTRRRENDGPETVEIVLDRPIPMRETTRFTFDDGVAINEVEYTVAPGDTDGDGDADLHDFAVFQQCFSRAELTGACLALDFDANQAVNLDDYAEFGGMLHGP